MTVEVAENLKLYSKVGEDLHRVRSMEIDEDGTVSGFQYMEDVEDEYDPVLDAGCGC